MIQNIIKKTVVLVLIFTVLSMIGTVQGDWSVDSVLAFFISSWKGLFIWALILLVVVSIYSYLRRGK